MEDGKKFLSQEALCELMSAWESLPELREWEINGFCLIWFYLY